MLELTCHQECEFIYDDGSGLQHKRMVPRKVYWRDQPDAGVEQWVVQGLDIDSGDIMDFALCNIVVPTSEVESQTAALQGNGNGQA